MRASVVDIRAAHDLTGVELRHLRALDAVARRGTLSDAGRELRYSQSAISQQLTQLERLVGRRLVERAPGGRTVALTPAGERLAAHAAAVAGRLAEAGRELADGAAVVRLGAVPSAAALLLPGIAGAVRTPLEVSESYLPDELLDDLAAGLLDLVVAPSATPRPGIDARHLLDDPYVVLAPAGHPLTALGRPLAATDLDGVPLVAKSCGTPSQRALEAALAARGIAPAVRLRAHDARTVHGLVAAGAGVAVVPGLVAEPGPGLAIVPAEHVVPPRRIALHARAGRARDEVAAVAAAVVRAASAPARLRAVSVAGC
jgi:molybdate transport repressor ModE-like protein